MQILQLAWWQLLLVFLPLALNFWCIWHSFNHNFNNPSERLYWMLAGVFLPLFGGLAYLLFGYKRAVSAKK